MSDFNLHHATFKQALVYAKALSGMTNEEIAEASGINGPQVSRYFQEHDAYAPAPYLLPTLCRVLGNTVLVDWLNAQVAELRPATSIRNVQDLTMAVMRATENTGALRIVRPWKQLLTAPLPGTKRAPFRHSSVRMATGTMRRQMLLKLWPEARNEPGPFLFCHARMGNAAMAV